MTTSEIDSPATDASEAAGRDGAEMSPTGNWSPNTPPPDAAPTGNWSPNTPPPDAAPTGNWSPNTPPPSVVPTGNWSPNTPPPSLVPAGNWSPNTPPPGTVPVGNGSAAFPSNGDGAQMPAIPARTGVITQVWSSSATPGVWVLVYGVGWRRLASSETGHGALVTLALLARSNGMPVSFREDALGQIDELLV